MIPSDKRSVAAWADTLLGIRATDARHLFEIGVYLESARAELTEGEFLELMKIVEVDDESLGLLLTIIEDENLSDVSRDILPASLSKLAMLCGLTRDQFRDGLAHGVIRPDVTVSEITKLHRS